MSKIRERIGPRQYLHRAGLLRRGAGGMSAGKGVQAMTDTIESLRDEAPDTILRLLRVPCGTPDGALWANTSQHIATLLPLAFHGRVEIVSDDGSMLALEIPRARFA